jgi:peptidyl-prolyl cis-trans isomerase B (cyclophilin B)
MIRDIAITCFFLLSFFVKESTAQPELKLRKKDRNRDIEMTTTEGVITLRLEDETPLHRDNFLKLVKVGFYDGILFHRVIRGFMIQAGDPKTRRPSEKTNQKNDSSYTIPAEFNPSLFHKRGALAAARMGDDVNPQKASSGTQYYIVQGRIFTNASLDSVETHRLKGRKVPPYQRDVYTSVGGAPHLDQNYTVFGWVIAGMEVVDRIAATSTATGPGANKPLTDIRILDAKLVKRKSTP